LFNNTNILSDGEELLEIVDINGKVMGLAKRSELHGNPLLVHRVVHVLIFDEEGRLLLQKRSLKKDVAPGKWDTSVGGHVNPGEDLLDAAKREMKEELGIENCVPDYRHSYLFSNNVESELVSTFSCVYNNSLSFSQEEIEEIAFWDMEKIQTNLGKNIFSAHFEKEITDYFQNYRI
jgi:isopentenyldiphosphate isomerase